MKQQNVCWYFSTLPFSALLFVRCFTCSVLSLKHAANAFNFQHKLYESFGVREKRKCSQCWAAWLLFVVHCFWKTFSNDGKVLEASFCAYWELDSEKERERVKTREMNIILDIFFAFSSISSINVCNPPLSSQHFFSDCGVDGSVAFQKFSDDYYEN